MEKIKGILKRENAFREMTPADAAACEAYAKDYLGYLGIAKTERRAYDEAIRRIEALGFKELSTMDALKPGDKVLCRTDQAGRHFGMRIKEDIQEK